MGQTAFAVPVHADAKIVVPLTVLLGFMFVQGFVATELPRSEGYSLLAVYILACELLTCVNCLMCSICMWLSLNGLRVSPRASRIILRASCFLLLHNTPTPPAPPHSKEPVHSKTAEAEDAVNDAHSNLLNEPSPQRPVECVSSVDTVEAAYHANVQQSQQIEISPPATGKTRRSAQLSAADAGELMARLLNRVLSVFHLAAITLLFVSLIFFPLILLR